MKKIIIGIAFTTVAFQSSEGMQKAFASFADAVAGKQRNFMEEITTILNDGSLPESEKHSKAATIYTELRNFHRGKEQYAEYNQRACEHRETARKLKQQEDEAKRQALELAAQKYAQARAHERALERAQQERFNTEKQLTDQISAARNNKAMPHLERWNILTKCYKDLLILTQADENKEQYNLYKDRLTTIEPQEKFCELQDRLKKTSDKGEQANILRKISTICTSPQRAHSYLQKAELMEKEIFEAQEEVRFEAIKVRYEEILALIGQTNDASQKAKLYHTLSLYSNSEDQAQAHTTQAKALEVEAVKEQEHYQCIITKTCLIVGLNMEILKTDRDKTLTPFLSRSILANLVEQRYHLAQEIPKYKSEFSQDLERVAKLRREAIAYAPTDAEKLSIIKLLN